MNVKKVYWKQMFEINKFKASKSFCWGKENKTLNIIKFPLISFA
jgi:hypothetical protein